MNAHIPVAISLGSNMGDRMENLRLGFAGLESLLAGTLISAIFETAPMHVLDQPPFLNACCLGSTRQGPRELMRALQSLEEDGCRVPQSHVSHDTTHGHFSFRNELGSARPLTPNPRRDS